MSKEPIKCVIIDDEQDSIGVLKHLIEHHCPELYVADSFDNSIDALAYLTKSPPDLIFLDIEMPLLNGFELLEKLGTSKFRTVIVSAYDQFGIKAVKSDIFDYILKPIDPVELKTVVRRYKDSIGSNDEQKIQIVLDRIMIPEANSVRFVPVSDIVRCESDNNYTSIYLNTSDHIVISKTLKVIEESLPASSFIRVHNQHLIQISYIKRYCKSDGGYFELIDGAIVPLSRYRRDTVLAQLKLK